MTLDEYFNGQDLSRQIYEALYARVKEISPVEIRVTKSQVAFIHGKAFAWAWMPGKYLKGKFAPLVLTLVFPYRNASTRWKEIVEPSPENFTHHLELYSPSDVDEQVVVWLQEAMAARK
jgi:hypothetical protein